MMMESNGLLRLVMSLSFVFLATVSAAAQQKPSILVIWGDDIGITNISAYSRGMMGYTTPNIDRVGDALLHLEAAARGK